MAYPGLPTPTGALHYEAVVLWYRTPNTQAILSLLRYSLAEIADAWGRGVLQEEGLGGREVQRLVQALFEASDARQRVLTLVAS